uniref:Uncharacterized protein n=1 Tax=Moorena producens (strain JHB) TaxID=1454205 RepID=A0A1D9FWG2_MOOP1
MYIVLINFSAISCQLSAVSYQPLAISYQLSVKLFSIEIGIPKLLKGNREQRIWERVITNLNAH